MRDDNPVIYKKAWGNLLVATLTLSTLQACGSSYTYESEDSSAVVYEAGTHSLLEVDRNFSVFGKSGKYGLTAPDGYRISDYDYDKWDDFEFNDYVYVNDEDVRVTNPDKPGTPVNKSEESDTYKPGEHVIVDIERSFNPFYGKDDTSFALTAPAGYDILDYDYDKTDIHDFENITYVNNTEITLDDKNEFGTPVDDIVVPSHKDGNYDIGEHKFVVLTRNLNIFWGKNEKKQIIAPPGYRIIDYDYDKTDTMEFETVTYENIVPVHVDDENTFGVSIDPIEEEVIENNIYKPGQHVLVHIDRNFEFWYGFNGTRELSAPDGYTLLDYDYDKTDDFEFETYVYVNNVDVLVNDVNDFGEVVNQRRGARLELK